jgi:hypothetical protein
MISTFIIFKDTDIIKLLHSLTINNLKLQKYKNNKKKTFQIEFVDSNLDKD